MAKVTVYRFTSWSTRQWESLVAPRAGTREAIARAGGTPLEQTALEVDESELDPDGFVTRRPEDASAPGA